MLALPKFPFEGPTPIVVTMTNGLNEGGMPNEAVSFTGTCHFDEKSKTRRGKDGIDITLSGLAIIDGDIAPTLEIITGHVAMNGGGNRKIFQARRIRDLSGNVHHTELELI